MRRKKRDCTWEKNGNPGWRAEHTVVYASHESRGNDDQTWTPSHDRLEMVRQAIRYLLMKLGAATTK